MRHNQLKLAALNDNAKKYSYTIGDRDYLHSSTLVSLCYETFKCLETTVSLRKPVTKGYFFDDIPGEDDSGFVTIDNTNFYIKSDLSSLERLAENKLSEGQQKLFFLNTLVQTTLDLNAGLKKRYLSRKLTVHCPLVFSESEKKIDARVTTFDNYLMIDVSFNNLLVCRQYVQPNRAL